MNEIEKPIPPLRSEYREALEQYDAGDLFKEWSRQAKLAMDWVEHHSEAFFYRRMLERKKKLIKSDLIKAIKNDPFSYGINDGKTPAEVLKACYQSHPDYQQAEVELIQAQYEEMILEGAKWQIKERKDALENMVNMVLSGIYGRPKEPDILRDPASWSPSSEEQRQATGRALIRRKKV